MTMTLLRKCVFVRRSESISALTWAVQEAVFQFAPTVCTVTQVQVCSSYEHRKQAVVVIEDAVGFCVRCD